MVTREDGLGLHRASAPASRLLYQPTQCVGARTMSAVCCLQQRLLKRLGRHREELVVCEQLLALAQQHFSGDEYVPQDIGVPWCMY